MIDTALILAAGLGTRLAPLSAIRAKAALPVAGEAIIRHQARWLAAAGVRHVIVNLHHLPGTVTAALGHGDDLGVTVRYSWEGQVLGSAGGPRQALDLVDAERLLVVNGDTITDLDLKALVAEHARTQPLVTMAATHTARPGYNALLVSDAGCLAGVTRVGEALSTDPPAHHAVHFMGVQVIERRAFADVPPGTAAETVKWLYPLLLARDASSVRVWRRDAAFHDVGTPAEYLRTAQTMAAQLGRPLDCGTGVQVEPSAQVLRSVLWNDVRVGAGAAVTDCVLGDGVVVPPGLRLTHATVVRRDSQPPSAPGRAHGDLLVVPFTRAAK